MNTRVAPLLLRGAWSVTRAPGGHTTIVGFLDFDQRDAGGGSLLL